MPSGGVRCGQLVALQTNPDKWGTLGSRSAVSVFVVDHSTNTYAEFNPGEIISILKK